MEKEKLLRLLVAGLSTVVSFVKTLVVEVTFYADPVGLVHPAPVSRGRAARKSTRHLHPSFLPSSDIPHFFGYFGEILVLAEDEDNVAFFLTHRPDNIQRNSDVYAFFLPNEERVPFPAGKRHRLIPISERPREDDYASSSHDAKLGFPEMMPECIVGSLRNAGVEVDVIKRPALCITDGPGERQRVVIGI